MTQTYRTYREPGDPLLGAPIVYTAEQCEEWGGVDRHASLIAAHPLLVGNGVERTIERGADGELVDAYRWEGSAGVVELVIDPEVSGPLPYRPIILATPETQTEVTIRTGDCAHCAWTRSAALRPDGVLRRSVHAQHDDAPPAMCADCRRWCAP